MTDRVVRRQTSPEAGDQLLATVGDGDGEIRTCVGHGGGGPVQPGLTGHVQAMPRVAGAGPHPKPIMTATATVKATSEIWDLFIVYIPPTDILGCAYAGKLQYRCIAPSGPQSGFPKMPGRISFFRQLPARGTFCIFCPNRTGTDRCGQPSSRSCVPVVDHPMIHRDWNAIDRTY